MIYPNNFEQKIGFNGIRQMLATHCISQMGLERAESVSFTTNINLITKSLEQTEEFISLLQQGVPFPMRDFHDLREAFHRIQIEGTCLSIEDLFALKPSLNVLEAIMRFGNSENVMNFPRLKALTDNIFIEKKVFTEANRLVDDKGEIPDNASPELQEIRQSVRRKQGGIDRRIRQIMSDAKTAGWVDQKSEITIRDGRLVIPVKAADKRALRGFIHDESATGQTVYIEPAEIFDTSNEIKELEYAEKREIHKILLGFTALLRPYLSELRKAWSMLGEMDFIRAKALLAQEIGGVKPALRNGAYFNWIQARHPILEQKLKIQGKEIVPLDLKLDGKDRILVISGPNAGGKSVCLKTTGLIQYMLQCGLMVPMRIDSECGLFESLFIDIGDEQSLENDLSTYSSHLHNMKTLLENATSNSLFLIDEFGTGTEPQLGGAIAEAILLELNKKEVFGIVTTHYANLKLLADNNEGIINGAMLFDTKFMQPMYIMMTGKPGSSFAFEIAKKIGFPKYILENAATITGDQHLKFEQQLLQLEVDKKAIRKKEQDLKIADQLLTEVVTKYKNLLAELESKKKQYIRDAAKEAKELIESANSKIERTIKEIKEAQAEKEKTKELRKELQETKEAIVKKGEAAAEPKKPKPVDDGQLKVGDTVCIDDMQVVGEIIAISDTDATILFDSIKLRTSPDKLRKVSRAEGRKTMRKWQASIADDLSEKAEHFELTLDVRGKRAEEALDIVEKYIDEAKLLSIKEVSILHGKGNGILRKLIREYLSHQHEIENFCDASLETGGAGITRVYFR
ncbi:MAG: Smr/MutS family protein [Bacteroidales bacterium]|nr:Smr/MutS family protein [Bacteroidales bacterium]